MWWNRKTELLSSVEFSVHTSVFDARCTRYQEACKACKCKWKRQKQTVFSLPQGEKNDSFRKDWISLNISMIKPEMSQNFLKNLSVNGSHFHGHFWAVWSIHFGIDTLLILSYVHQCLLIKHKILDSYFDNQNFRRKRSLVSGISFTTGT